jgi:hypothetical protein
VVYYAAGGRVILVKSDDLIFVVNALRISVGARWIIDGGVDAAAIKETPLSTILRPPPVPAALMLKASMIRAKLSGTLLGASSPLYAQSGWTFKVRRRQGPKGDHVLRYRRPENRSQGTV